jgi:FlaA1/EpsC-like NDP-sugar epimerase
MGFMERLRDRISDLPRSGKYVVMMSADAVLLPAALWLAFLLKYGSSTYWVSGASWLFAGVAAASLAIFTALRVYRSAVRYLGLREIASLMAGAVASASIVWLLGEATGVQAVSLSVAVIYALLALAWLGGSRLLARRLLLPGRGYCERVAVYGAGEAGVRLARALTPDSGLTVAAFVDDKKELQRSLIDGRPVLSPKVLRDLVRDRGISRVLLAIPTASRRRRAEIIQQVERLGLRVQTVPDLADLVNGQARVEDIREVDAGDLLGRDPVAPQERLIEACIRGKVVLVTGAGGSIGAELCRQIARLGPRRLVLLDLSELALYHIDRELRALEERDGFPLELAALLGSVQDQQRLREILRAYGVQTVYHAAAYKHVPIVERNVTAAVRNNVLGTWSAAEAALECRVETFVLVSTDKAVNPTNVMGATKRMAEMALQGLQQHSTHTRFCMVRFGNVLESSGSVVPLFREQIRRGGPVTVTHPEIIRYFMTIPEAAQLVLQAGAMAQGGDVFVLDMGQPVRIADVARRMIHLSGLTVRDEAEPDGDIEIQFTGLRPGEKLYEELLIGKKVTATEHPMILRATEHCLPWNDLLDLLDELLIVVADTDVPAVRELLQRAVCEYRPSVEVVDEVWRQRAPEPGTVLPRSCYDENGGQSRHRGAVASLSDSRGGHPRSGQRMPRSGSSQRPASSAPGA